MFGKNKKSNTDNSAGRIIDENTSFETVETYKTIRTNIMFSMPKSKSGKVIVVTGSMPSEGKTTTAINLAITFAQMGAKVLLADCDLRKPRIHRYLGIEKEDGVSNILCGFCDAQSAIKKDVRENLDCLTSGGTPPNPAELLESDEFTELLAQLKESYDYIFIDTPPTTVVTDAAIIFAQCSGVVVVIRQNITSFDLLDVTMDTISKANAKALGFVVLGTDEKRGKYYGKGKYGYRYKYSYSPYAEGGGTK